MRRTLALLALLALLAGGLSLPAAAQEDLGSISGTITDADSGEPIAGVNVSVSGPDFGGAATATDGTYTVTNLPPGWYRVGAGAGIEPIESDWIGKYFDDRPDWASADQVKLDAGEDITGIDLELVLGGVIQGQVTHAWTGEPIQYVYPAVEHNHPQWGWSQISAGGSTDEEGRYRVGGLSGEYRVTLWDNDYLEYRSSVMTIEPGTTTTHDIVLTPAHGSPDSSVYGRACVGFDCLGADESAALAGMTVTAIRPDGTELGSAITDSWGWFSLEGLEPGTIVVRLADPLPGMELVFEPELELGPNESAWDVSLAYRPLPVHFLLTATGPTDVVEADSDFDVTFTLTVAEADATFPVTDTGVRLRVPAAVEVIGHTSDGPFDPDTGLWVSDPSADNPTRLTITLRAGESGEARISAEVAGANWPDPTAVFGDGQGDDFAALRVEIVDLVVGPPTEQPTIVGGGEIRGTVYLDEDADGVFDEEDTGASGIEVVLISTTESRLPIATDDQGKFVFEDVAPGSYRVEVVTTATQILTTPDHLLTVGADSVLAGVEIGITRASGPVPVWFFLVGGLVIVGLAGLTGYGIGRTRRSRVDEPSSEQPLVGAGVR